MYLINVTCLLPCRLEPLQGSVEKRLAVLLSMGLCDAFALFERWTLYFCLQSLKQVEFSLSVGTEVMLVLSSFLPDLPPGLSFLSSKSLASGLFLEIP